MGTKGVANAIIGGKLVAAWLGWKGTEDGMSDVYFCD